MLIQLANRGYRPGSIWTNRTGSHGDKPGAVWTRHTGSLGDTDREPS